MNLNEYIATLSAAVDKRMWIGIDFDGTLVKQLDFPKVGKPIGKMVRYVKGLLSQGKRVKIFSARAAARSQAQIVSDWTKKYLGQRLDVTNVKDNLCIKIVDNIATGVKKNEGTLLSSMQSAKFNPKLPDEERQTRVVEEKGTNKTDGTEDHFPNDFRGKGKKKRRQHQIKAKEYPRSKEARPQSIEDGFETGIRAGGPGSGRHPYGVLLKKQGFKKVTSNAYRRQSGTLGEYITLGKNGGWSHSAPGVYKDAKGKSSESLEKHLTGGIHAGGPGSGRTPYGSNKVTNAKGWKVDSRRSQIGKQNPVRIALADQKLAEGKIQGMVAKWLGGKVYGRDSEPVDVIAKDSKGRLHGIEVKGVLKAQFKARTAAGLLPQISMKTAQIQRKLDWAKQNGAQGRLHVVVVDVRNSMSKPTVYHSTKLGSISYGNDSRASAKSVSGGIKSDPKDILG